MATCTHTPDSHRMLGVQLKREAGSLGLWGSRTCQHIDTAVRWGLSQAQRGTRLPCFDGSEEDTPRLGLKVWVGVYERGG